MKREPEFDHGFYVAVPRMVRTGYAQLSVTQKWLYVCLKDLAGETGTCFRSIQTLKEETGISTGMISMSIHELHKSGLIHAEMKQRTNGGKPVWHITIADIWAANGKAHPSKRSPGEQTLENVHSVNKNVQQVNKNKGDRSPGEQERSPGETEERKEKKDHSEERKEKKIAASAQVQSPTPNSLSLSKSSSLLDQLTDEQADFWTRWCAFAGEKQELNETAYKHVVSLATKIRTTADLQSLYDYSYALIEALAKKQGKEVVAPRLGNLDKWEPEWSQIQGKKQQEKEQEQATHEHIPGTGKLTNWTQARIAGNQPPINYDPLPTVKPAGSSGLSQVGNISAGLQERIRQARERRATQS